MEGCLGFGFLFYVFRSRWVIAYFSLLLRFTVTEQVIVTYILSLGLPKVSKCARLSLPHALVVISLLHKQLQHKFCALGCALLHVNQGIHISGAHCCLSQKQIVLCALIN